MTATRKVIALWLDKTSDYNDSAWIVSRDKEDKTGGAETTDTVHAFAPHEYDEAKQTAIALGREEGLPIVEIGVLGERSEITTD